MRLRPPLPAEESIAAGASDTEQLVPAHSPSSVSDNCRTSRAGFLRLAHGDVRRGEAGPVQRWTAQISVRKGLLLKRHKSHSGHADGNPQRGVSLCAPGGSAGAEEIKYRTGWSHHEVCTGLCRYVNPRESHGTAWQRSKIQDAGLVMRAAGQMLDWSPSTKFAEDCVVM